jgi:hypothetical protein
LSAKRRSGSCLIAYKQIKKNYSDHLPVPLFLVSHSVARCGAVRRKSGGAGGREASIEENKMAKVPVQRLGYALASTCLLAACQASAEPPQSAADEASQVVRTRCGPEVDETALGPILSGSVVRSAKPLYNNIEGSKGGDHAELRGAIVAVDAMPGITAEWLDRTLECHSARLVLGQGQEGAAARDPFWLPGSVVDIDVKSSRSGFLIAVAGASPDKARQVLDRARLFVSEKVASSAK